MLRCCLFLVPLFLSLSSWGFEPTCSTQLTTTVHIQSILATLERYPEFDSEPVRIWKQTLQNHMLSGQPWNEVRISPTPGLTETIDQIREKASQFEITLRERHGFGSTPSQQTYLSQWHRDLETLVGPQGDIGYFDLLKVTFQLAAMAKFVALQRSIDSTEILVAVQIERQFIEDKTILREYLERAVGLLYIPTFESLGFFDLNEPLPLPAHWINLVETLQEVDGLRYDPLTHVHHDRIHGALIEGHRAGDKLNRTEGSPDFLLERTALQLEARLQLHKKYLSSRLHHAHSKREVLLFDALWFLIFRERQNVMSLIAAQHIVSHHKNSITDDFIKRLRDRKDFGQAFKSTPTATEVDTVWSTLAYLSDAQTD